MLKCPHVPRRGRRGGGTPRAPRSPRGTGPHPGLLVVLEGRQGDQPGTRGGKGSRWSPTAAWRRGRSPSTIEGGVLPLLGLEPPSLKMMAGAASWQHSRDPQLHRYAPEFSAAHLTKAAVANNRARARNANPRDNEPGGGRRWAPSEEGAVLLLERPKRAINPQIQRRTPALSSPRKAWDVSAGRTNHAASPAEVASSAKPRCSPGYYTQILSICCPPGCRQGTPSSLPALRGEPTPTLRPGKNWPPPALRGGRTFAPIPPFQRTSIICPPKRWGEPGGGPRTSPSRSAAILQRAQTKNAEPSTITSPSVTASPSIAPRCRQTRGCHPCVQTHTPDRARTLQKTIKTLKPVGYRRRCRVSALPLMHVQPQTFPSLNEKENMQTLRDQY